MNEPTVADLMRERVLPHIDVLHRWHGQLVEDRGVASPADIARALEISHELTMGLAAVILRLCTQINTPVTMHAPPSDEPHPRGH